MDFFYDLYEKLNIIFDKHKITFFWYKKPTLEEILLLEGYYHKKGLPLKHVAFQFEWDRETFVISKNQMDWLSMNERNIE